MFTPSISNMKPEDIMRKKAFTRIAPKDSLAGLGGPYVVTPTPQFSEGQLSYITMTQADFMREFDQNAHKIMSKTYYPNPITYDKKEKKYYEKVLTRVTVNLPEIFANQRTSILTGNDIDLKLMSDGKNQKMQDRLSSFSEGWALRDMEVAVYELVYGNAVTGDAAIACYIENGQFGWRSLSYMKGDVLYPHYDTYGRLALFGRKYVQEEKGNPVVYLDVWDKTKYYRYRQDTSSKSTVWKMEGSGTPHGFNRIPIVYYRYGEPFWSGAMNSVDGIELALSQLYENNKQYALRILVSLGGTMQVKASMDGTPRQINSPDPNAKVSFLEPADASGSFELQLNKMIKFAYQAAHCVEAPELKSGADVSSLTVQMLYADVFHQALLDAKSFQAGLNDLVTLYQYGWGIETGKPNEFDPQVFRVKGKMIPYIMKSENEEVNNISTLANAGGLPKKAVAEESYKLGYGTPRNYEELKQEEHDALLNQTTVQKTNSVNASRQQ